MQKFDVFVFYGAHRLDNPNDILDSEAQNVEFIGRLNAPSNAFVTKRNSRKSLRLDLCNFTPSSKDNENGLFEIRLKSGPLFAAARKRNQFVSSEGREFLSFHRHTINGFFGPQTIKVRFHLVKTAHLEKYAAP